MYANVLRNKKLGDFIVLNGDSSFESRFENSSYMLLKKNKVSSWRWRVCDVTHWFTNPILKTIDWFHGPTR